MLNIAELRGRANRVGPKGQVRAVLLNGTDRNERDIGLRDRSFKILDRSYRAW